VRCKDNARPRSVTIPDAQVMETVEKVLATLGASDIDTRLEELL
jgi:hypothetical protein